jgi:hypothetical protein
MSDHSDAPYPATDITDLYAFQKPGDPAKSILIVNVNPDAQTQRDGFDPMASYELKVDTDGDLRAEIAYHFLFTAPAGGRQTAAVHRIVGTAAERSRAAGELVIDGAPISLEAGTRVCEQGEYRFYAGLRSDPWFADVAGFLNNFQFTGRDSFADSNVLSIVLEVPNRMLGHGGRLGIWARTVVAVHGVAAVVDQAGHPLINALFNSTVEEQHAFSRTPPAQQRERYLPRFTAALQGFGYGDTDAAAIAGDLLPDILSYDPANAAGYPNGRQPTDDIVDLRLAMITRQRVTTDLVGPHGDLLAKFPYLGPPHGV